MKCIVDIDEMPDAPHPDKPARPVTGYYQWVTFVMAIQAAIFYLPHKVRIQLFWHQIFSTRSGCLLKEGSWNRLDRKQNRRCLGRESYCQHFSPCSQILLRKRTGYEDSSGIMMEDVVEKFVKYFKSILHHNNWYFAYFVSCK